MRAKYPAHLILADLIMKLKYKRRIEDVLKPLISKRCIIGIIKDEVQYILPRKDSNCEE
jgi:hypothetical protein